jgi:hypothetical protein
MSQQSELELLLPLRAQEIDLLKLIRGKYRWGKIELEVRDGIPTDIVRTVERERLSTEFS